jgi:hypothetical protein
MNGAKASLRGDRDVCLDRDLEPDDRGQRLRSRRPVGLASSPSGLAQRSIKAKREKSGSPFSTTARRSPRFNRLGTSTSAALP